MYSRHSEIYDQVHTFKDYASEVQSLLRLIDKLHPTARTLLDVACGTGIHLELLQGRFEVSGLDINSALLTEAAERVPDARLHACDMESFQAEALHHGDRHQIWCHKRYVPSREEEVNVGL